MTNSHSREKNDIEKEILTDFQQMKDCGVNKSDTPTFHIIMLWK